MANTSRSSASKPKNKDTTNSPSSNRQARARRHRANGRNKEDNRDPDDEIIEAAIVLANNERNSKERSPSPTRRTTNSSSGSSESGDMDISLVHSPEKMQPTRANANDNGTPATSALKQGRYSARPSTPAPERMHIHEHTRVIVEAALKFDSGEDRFNTLLSGLGSLLTYGQMVDEHFVINPVREGGRDKDWKDPAKLPTSMTALGAHLAITSSTRVFEKSRAGGKEKKDTRPDTVYFSFAISSDLAPDEIMSRIAVDWSLLGGTRLAVKALNYFDTCTPIAIYFLWNEGHSSTLLDELSTILLSVVPADADGITPPSPH